MDFSERQTSSLIKECRKKKKKKNYIRFEFDVTVNYSLKRTHQVLGRVTITGAESLKIRFPYSTTAAISCFMLADAKFGNE